MILRDPQCRRCPLGQSETVRTRCVPGDGPLSAEILLLGEAPGDTEDKIGLPFKGQSGALLRKCVEGMLGLVVRYENVARCRPEGNRPPTEEEREACRPWLEAAVQAMPRLKFVVPLGASAMKACGLKGSVLKKAGIPVGGDFCGKTVTFIPIAHPAYVLRNRTYISEWQQHWEGIAAIARAGDGPPVEERLNLLYYQGFAEVPADFLASPVLAVDLETTGLEPKNGSVMCVGISNGDTSIGVWIETARDLELVGELLSRPGTIVHNAPFEGTWDREFWGRQFQGVDTLLMCKRMDPALPAALGAVGGRINPEVGGYKVESDTLTGQGMAYFDLPPDVLLRRTAIDARLTFDIDRRAQEKLTPAAYAMSRRDAELAVLVEKVARKGLPFSQERAVALRAECDKEQAEAKAMCEQVLGYEFNPGSPQQVAAELDRRDVMLPLNETTGGPVTDAITLKSILHYKNPDPETAQIIEQVLRYRKAGKTAGTYVAGYAKRQDSDGLIRTSLRWPGTITWRLSSSKPNLQNVQKDIRDLFVAPPGKLLVEVDYSQIELWLATMLSGDEAFIRCFRDGLDPHGMLAAENFGPAFTQEQRGHAKTTNYGALYGAGDYTLWQQYIKKGVFLPRETVANFHAAFWRLHPELKAYMSEQMDQAMKGRPMVAPAWAYQWTVEDFMLAGAPTRQDAALGATNAPIQCVPPRLTLEAIEILDKEGIDVRLHTHDGALILADEDKAEEVGRRAKQVFDEASAKYDFWRGTPCTAAVKIGRDWKNMEEVK